MSNTYGKFDDSNREYIITNPSTPTKWVNYVGSLQFGGLVDHTGGSLLCAGDPALNRIVKYIPQLPDTDFKGSTLYIRVRTSSGQEVYSPFYTPCLDELDSFECRVGLSYQTITSSIAGIQVQAQIFVPYGASLEIRNITVTNNREEAVEIDIIPVVEYTHFDALKQYTNADWCPQTMMSEAHHEDGGLLTLFQYAFMRKQGKLNFMSSNRPVDSFESDRKKFLGTKGTWAKPAVMGKESFSSYEALRGDNIGALLIKLGSFAPSESKRTLIYTGQAEREDALGVINHFRNEGNVDQSFADLSKTWDSYLNAYQCDTPDKNINAMLNIHNPRQCQTTFYWSRYLSLYQLGLGARGLGFRDSSQDSMGVLASIPKEAKELQKKLLSIQKENGSAMHQFFPSTMEANEGDSREEGDKQWYGDDHLWIVLAVSAYLRETGDYAFLDEEIPFYDKGLKLADRVKAPVLEHLKRSLAFTKANTGQHGLPLLGFADWNDTVNLPGEAESLMIASLYGTGLNEMIDLCEHLGDKAQADQYRADHAAMKKVVNEEGWDGEWYRRYYTAAGEPIGSKENEYGSIYTNAQSWPVIAGFAEGDRAKTALDSVDKHLNTKFGIKLSTPGYNGYDEELGGVSSYPPGAKENGGIFLHSNPWVMIANCLIGNGDRAYKYFNQINPAARNEDIDLFEVEPYCFPQNILGDEHPQFGLGRNSWLSGTSSWTYQAATQYILGVKPGHNGLVVTPCAPKDWNSYKVVRQYRGATYNITVEREYKGDDYTTQLVVNGHELAGNTVPIAMPGTTCEVLVKLTAAQVVASMVS